MSSSYIETSSIKVFNSNWLSTLTSVSLHGLALFLIVPYLTNVSNPEPKTTDPRPRNVQVIELNPTEQSRLPDQNSALSNIPKFPNSTLGDLPILNSPSLGSSFSNLPAPPALPPLPPLNPYNNYNRFPIAPPPRSIPFTPPSINRPLIPPPSLQSPTPKTPPVNNAEIPQQVDPRQSIDFGEPTVGDVDNPAFQNNRPNPEQTALNPNKPSRQSNNPNRSAIRQAQIARNLLADSIRRSNNLIRNPNGTTREEAAEKDREWILKTGVTDISRNLMPITGNYPKAACNLKLEGSAVYNVEVNSNGQVVGQPYMTQSSGYGLLNNQGLQQIKALSFPKATRVKVTFRYDPSVCPQGLRQGENIKQPQPARSPQTQPNQPSKTPTENKTPLPPNSSPQAQPEQPPKTPTENKTPLPPNSSPQAQPEQPPKTPTEDKTINLPDSSPQTPPNQPPKTPTEDKIINPPDASSENKGERVVAPPRGKK
ncbi:MAG: energy transducer TonB [Crocosphaera sp.]